MSLRARLTTLERRLPPPARRGGPCRGCGWPGPDSTERGGATNEDLAQLRSIFAAASRRRGAAACPRCGEPFDRDFKVQCAAFTDGELDAVGATLARIDGETWPADGEELDRQIAVLEAELASGALP